MSTAWLACTAVLLVACGGGDDGGGGESGVPSGKPRAPAKALRVYESPYAGVDWTNDIRMKAQFHDHPGTTESRLRAYDKAGYAAVSLMDYSGAPNLSYAWKTRRWPAESWLSSTFRESLDNIRVFVPSAEEVGDPQHHLTSPFLTTYIESWDPRSGQPRQDWQYASGYEVPQLVRQLGGLACLAHSWNATMDYSGFPNLRCVEIYNALGEAKQRQGDPAFTRMDANAVLVGNWDRALARNQYIIGIAVNDHYGPDAAAGTAPAEVIDSGKIIVLSQDLTLGAFREAFERGAVLAVRDLDAVKDLYPEIGGISHEETRIRIETDGTVQWIAAGNQVAHGPEIDVSLLPRTSNYVRAEITGSNDTTVYTQAFVLRPLGDIDGDFDEDAADRTLCERVSAGTETNPVYVAACKAIAAQGGG